MAAPRRNTNSTKPHKLFGQALRRALVQEPEKMAALAKKLIALAEAGEAWAFKELVDRLDGKAVQPIAGSDEDPPIQLQGVIKLVRPG